ncbi:hypothetical protein MBOE_37340 [Mycolicibacterium boenickei]|uniref:Uncharacterized protein n=1 Tax=Mycolicibacterium boenickei TaxID=146017 RepID=A0ABN5ZEU9_9MYCO|nr:hypothetical protein MBOE_37340 [Mycolicibacterium boenickei]
MASKRSKRSIEQMRQDLFVVKERQDGLRAEHRRLIRDLDLNSGGESAILREQRRWNTSPPPLRPYVRPAPAQTP